MEITHVKVGPSVLQDELSGVRLVLTVIDVHLEFISLGNKERAACNVKKFGMQKNSEPLNILTLLA